MSFKESFDVMGRQLTRGLARAAFERDRWRHAVLGRQATMRALLDVMSDESAERWSEREAITRALVTEHQRDARGIWSSLLLCAFYPLLSRLRHRILGHVFEDDDLDQLVISCFLQVVAEMDLDQAPDRLALRLRQRTERQVFRALRLEQHEGQSRAELLLELEDKDKEPTTEDDPVEVEGDAAVVDDAITLLCSVASDHLTAPVIDLVVSTMLRQEGLRTYAARVNDSGEPDERFYQRLKRQRTRTMNRLRSLLEVTCPRGEAPWLCPNEMIPRNESQA